MRPALTSEQKDKLTIELMRHIEAQAAEMAERAVSATFSRVRRVYISGPMRGYDRFNFPAFDAAACRARALGWEVISPAEHDRSIGFDETLNSTDGFDLEAAIDWDIASIRSLKVANGDALAVLPGWRESRGARAEKALANWMGLAVLDAETFEPLAGEQ